MHVAGKVYKFLFHVSRSSSEIFPHMTIGNKISTLDTQKTQVAKF